MKTGTELDWFREPVLLYSYKRKPNQKDNKYGLYLCHCGKAIELITNNVKIGHSRSCGCLRSLKQKTHGLRFNPLYQNWVDMKKRCLKPKSKFYKNYGGRGITICDRWLNVANFVEDMYPSWEKGLTLERIDTNGNYEPNNCCWATYKEQMRNTRRNRVYTYNGITQCLTQWAIDTGINYNTLNSRLNNNDMEHAINFKRSNASKQ